MELDYPLGVGPVGLAIDGNGDLYSGLYNGSAIIKMSPQKKCVVETIKMPVRYVTAPAFGGPKKNILYATSSNLPVNFYTAEIGAPLRTPPNGNLFMIRGLCEEGTCSYPLHISSCW